MLVMSFIIAIIGYIGYRFLTRGERGSRLSGSRGTGSGPPSATGGAGTWHWSCWSG